MWNCNYKTQALLSSGKRIQYAYRSKDMSYGTDRFVRCLMMRISLRPRFIQLETMRTNPLQHRRNFPTGSDSTQFICLVFNHPRSEGRSLRGQVYSAFFCLSFSSIGLQTAFRSNHRILGLPCFLAPGVVPCTISFSRQSPSVLITCPNISSTSREDWILLVERKVPLFAHGCWGALYKYLNAIQYNVIRS